MVGSIDPRCETLRGTHWPKKGRLVVWNSRRGSHLGQRSTDRINRPDIWMQAIRSDRQKTLVARGPSTYGSPLKAGTTASMWLPPRPCRHRELFGAVALGHVDHRLHRRGEFVDVADIGEIPFRDADERLRRA